jgi:hypothetical protein
MKTNSIATGLASRTTAARVGSVLAMVIVLKGGQR